MVLTSSVMAGGKFGEGDTTWRADHIDNSRGGEYHTHAGLGRRFRGSEKDWKQKFRQEEWANAVGAHVGFVALDARAAGRGTADTRIVPENIEAGFLGEEGGCADCDRVEVTEVDVKTLEVSWACLVNGLYDFDFGGDFGGRATGHVDCAAFGVEDFDEFEPDAGISASDDEDFAR